MINPSRSARPGRDPRPGTAHLRPGPRRRLLAAPLVGLCAAAILLAPTAASADSSSTLTVVGTSDVSDSGLMANVIMPGFQAAFPQFTFKYVGTATGTAINNAETGTGGPSVLIVHAPSLENQFVAGGFSYEPYGRAIFTNDFVLAGPTGSADPAGVAANGAHDIVQAFADLATAGAAGTAEFVSRGGTPGTTVAEHQIWAQLGGSALKPAGLTLCTVSAAAGGGATPIASGTSGAPCPSTVPLPSWYATTGLTQGPNVQNADACSGYPSGAKCYVFTDRGTYGYLASGTDPAGSIPHLQILTRNNAASAIGGAGELINYFHAYIINPAAFTSQPNVTLNVPAAQDFVNFITSPGFQGQLKNYLGGAGDPPFVADASPSVTASGIPGVANANTTVTVSGSVANAEPFLPALANVPVTVSEVVGGLPVAVASGTTDASGNYRIGFVPTSNGAYQVSTGLISQIENATLTPPFGDLLQPGASATAVLGVQSAITITGANPSASGAVVSGAVAPGSAHANATVTILARPLGSTAAFASVGGGTLAASQSTYAFAAGLPAGTWQIEATFQDPARVLAATSGAVNVKVSTSTTKPGPPRTSVRFKKRTIKRGALTVTGTVSPAPTGKGAYVELLARHTTRVSVTRAAKKTKKVTYSRVGKVSQAKGRTSFTIHAKLTRGYKWTLELEYVQPSHKAAFSSLSSLNVH